MYLRNFEIEATPLMLEWMQDESVTENLQTIFSPKTLEDVKIVRMMNIWEQ